MLYSCSKCKLKKPATDFHKGHGRTGPRSVVATYCKLCMAAYSKAHEHNYKEHRIKYRARVRHYPITKVKQLLKVDGREALDFDWAWAKLQAQDFKCEITNEPFTWGSKEPTSLSIDRIDPTKGYSKDNVRFICWWMNTAMGDWGLEKVKDLIKKWQEQ